MKSFSGDCGYFDGVKSVAGDCGYFDGVKFSGVFFIWLHGTDLLRCRGATGMYTDRRTSLMTVEAREVWAGYTDFCFLFSLLAHREFLSCGMKRLP